MSDSNYEVPDIKLLKEFARQCKRDINISESEYQHSAIHPVRYHERKVYMSFDDNNDIYFVCYGDSRGFGEYSNYSGVFITTNSPSSSEFKIRKKDILDKMNPFLKESSFITTDNSFNKATVIQENDLITAKTLLDLPEIRSIILQTFDRDQLLQFGLNDIIPDFVPKLAGKSCLGFYHLNDWIIDGEEIKFIYQNMVKIKTILNF